MNIQEFIQKEILLPRVKRNGVLVVYDPERRYQELCHGLDTESLRVVDASKSSIESRELALKTLKDLGTPNTDIVGFLVYVPAPAPVTDEDRQRDPFALYTACGHVFPEGDGDEYMSLCLKAKPDHSMAVRGAFEGDSSPSFAVIDAIGGGLGWPHLQALLELESSRDILFALLVPNNDQQQALKEQSTWVAEARDLFKVSLSLKLKTRSKAWSTIADELWRFLLFSEFVFDLPEALPQRLEDVPHAHVDAQPMVDDLCDRLRNDQRTRDIYIDKAETIEQDLNLQSLCDGVIDLGKRDTFSFEERTFFTSAVEAITKGDTDWAREVIRRHATSIWTGKGESQVQWGLIDAALQLVETCNDFERQLLQHAGSQDTLIQFYLASLRQADRYQREFEQAVVNYLEIEGPLEEVIEQARGCYRRLAEKTQTAFIKQLEVHGWPPSGRLANADVFDQLVAPCLKESGRRVGYFLIDALRFELGVALQQQLREDNSVELQAAFAQLPSITKVGMASLLPGAGDDLSLIKKDDNVEVMMGDSVVANVSQRMNFLKKKYGDRFAEMQLNKFLGSNKKIPDNVHLLVLRTVDIDSHLENNPETTLSLIQDTLKRIRVAINKLKRAGFQDVVIATDHGFFLNAQAEAGDVCTKPAGTWVNVHERTLLGDGSADDYSFVVSSNKLGIRGDFDQVAGPRTMAPYRSGMLYFHGGASLQEAVVPVITAKLESVAQSTKQPPEVVLSYKMEATRITTRLPVIDVLLNSRGDTVDMFSQDEDFEILLEAHDKKGDVVGEAKPGGFVNAATGTITLKVGELLQVTMRMQMEFEGKFIVKALNPTTFARLSSLDLETDYAV